MLGLRTAAIARRALAKAGAVIDGAHQRLGQNASAAMTMATATKQQSHQERGSAGGGGGGGGSYAGYEEGSPTAGLRALQKLGLAMGAGLAGAVAFADVAHSDEAEHGLHPPSYPWPHAGIFSSYDHAA
ncbi:hypothetical protein CBR_g29835 [Chara braunii]|uniref:Uncharacterized protein n=1 Tax=Chara braunii TaxID=69332 RepID=A0A388JWT2_CHABU|nr:hypothetical protein CBR_g29835 [Chara braunii]|eukprot:GBG62227.1 hypothetical protein CBR_g29835 [Chara braunii]